MRLQKLPDHWIVLALLITFGVLWGALDLLINPEVMISIIGWGLLVLLGGGLVAFSNVGRFDVFSPVFFVGITISLRYGVGLLTSLMGYEGPYSAANILYEPYIPLAGAIAYWSLVAFYLGYAASTGARFGRG